MHSDKQLGVPEVPEVMRAMSLKDKEFDFLVECIEKAGDQYIKKLDIPFLQQVVKDLVYEEAVTTASLLEIYARLSSEPLTDKTLNARVKKLMEYLEEQQSALSALMPQFELTHYLKIEKMSGGGHAKMNRYELIRIAPSADSIGTLVSVTKPESSHVIRYSLNQLTKTPWWLRHLSSEFNHRTTRLSYLAAAMFIGYGLPVICILLMIFKVLTISQGAFLVLVSTLLSQKLVKVIDLIQHKIVELDFSELSLFALSVVTENSRGLCIEKAERRLVTGVIRADCPVCLQKYGIKNSVIVERKYAGFGPFIGKCLQNPQEHRFSFDKDLMVGERVGLDT
jgi:hypothetical protein